MNRAAEFEQLRPVLFSLAYRMLGTRAEAEDVVQDAYVRWESAGEHDVRAPKSYLTTIVARLSLDALKAAHRKRLTYVGPWLPEPLVEPLGTHSLELAESLSLAFLHVLESLSPAERAAFLLREVFDADYSEVAAALGITETNSRQIVSRAREHLRERRPRFTVDPERHRNVLREFLSACATGDPSRVAGLLSEQVVAYSDGGGKVQAAVNPVAGRDRVARFMAGLAKKGGAGLAAQFMEVNGETGVLLWGGGRPVSVLTLDLDAEGLIGSLFIVSNPDKLPAAGTGVEQTH